MKLKTQETIRGIEIASYLILFLTTITINEESKIETLQEIASWLQSNNIDLAEIKEVISKIYSIDLILNYRTQTLTTEHQKLKELYNKIIANTSELYKQFDLNDPVAIFAMYVYMYRKGYFSYHKEFIYGIDMKDFAKLCGIDVIRGQGVCRSISSMLTDIYNNMGLVSHNLSVNTDSETIKQMVSLSGAKLHSNVSSKRFVDIVSNLTKIIKFSNHMITLVEKEENSYIFDPTNDGFLYKGNKNQILLANNPDYYMKNGVISNSLLKILGQLPDGLIFNSSKRMNFPSITFEEYQKIYLETLELCQNNMDLFEQFYNNNRPYIDDIHLISKEQSGLIRRLIPIIPKK